MTALLAVAAGIALLEASKFAWHGKWRSGEIPACAHVFAIVALYYFVDYSWAAWVTWYVSTLAFWASYFAIKWLDIYINRSISLNMQGVYPRPPMTIRERILTWLFARRWPGWDAWHVLSALSSWPIELAAVLAVCWPLPGWLRYTALAGYAVEGLLLKRLVWHGPQRPTHWQ